MKIFVTGGNGMAGHMIVHYLRGLPHTNVYSSIREKSDNPSVIQLDLTDEKSVREVLHRIRPDVVIHAAGILNDETTNRLMESIFINSLLPHRLVKYSEEFGFRLIHISTDCVFSGGTGAYTESHPTDGTSVYAKTKSLGEVIDERHVTIRTSIIGPERRENGIGLFQWFMRQTGTIHGYQHVFWNGVTTLQLAKAIAWMLDHPLGGLVHLAADTKISKYELLQLIQEVFHKTDVRILPDTTMKSDKSLVNTRQDFRYTVPAYRTMIQELKQWMIVHQSLYPRSQIKGGE